MFQSFLLQEFAQDKCRPSQTNRKTRIENKSLDTDAAKSHAEQLRLSKTKKKSHGNAETIKVGLQNSNLRTRLLTGPKKVDLKFANK
jgi:hypothetical protein